MGSRSKHKIKKERMSQLSKAARSHRKYRDKDKEIERLRAELAVSKQAIVDINLIMPAEIITNKPIRAAKYFINSYRKLEVANKQLREGLRKLEWIGTDYYGDDEYPFCLACSWEKRYGHKPDCWLSALIGEGRE